MRETGKTGRFEVLSIDRVQPTADAAGRLGVSAKTKSVLRRENVFWADDDPLNRVTTYILWSIAKGTGLLQDGISREIFDEYLAFFTNCIQPARGTLMRNVKAYHRGQAARSPGAGGCDEAATASAEPGDMEPRH